MENNRPKDKSKGYLIAIIIILLLMNGYFIYHYVNTDRQLAEKTEVLIDTQSEKAELDSLLAESNEQIERYKECRARCASRSKECRNTGQRKRN
jgi:cell division protein FtsB